MSYQKLNQGTLPFSFLVPRCYYAMKEIDIEAKYFISVYMDIGYWQIVAEEEARKRLSLFTPDVKQRWKVIPMGDLNSAPEF